MRGDVPVDDPERTPALREPVRVGEAARHLHGDLHRARQAEPDAALPGALDHAAEVPPAHELHRDVVPAVDLVELEDLDDVGVAEPRGEARLLDEHPDEVAPRRVLAADELQRDLLHHPGRAGHLGAPHVGHPARRERLEEPVLAEGAHPRGIVPAVGARRAARVRTSPGASGRARSPGALPPPPAPPEEGDDEQDREREDGAAAERAGGTAPGLLRLRRTADEDLGRHGGHQPGATL